MMRSEISQNLLKAVWTFSNIWNAFDFDSKKSLQHILVQTKFNIDHFGVRNLKSIDTIEN